MTILVDWQIEDAIGAGRIGVCPFEPANVQPSSLDVRLGNSFVFFHHHSPIRYDEQNFATIKYASEEIIDPYNQGSLDVGEEMLIEDGESIVVEPYQFVLSNTLELFDLPGNIVGQLTGKSSLARVGLMVHATAGFIDPGFHGSITLELYNLNNRAIRLYQGMNIGQLVFTVTEQCCVPYSQKLGSKYSGQTLATKSRYYMNRKLL